MRALMLPTGIADLPLLAYHTPTMLSTHHDANYDGNNDSDDDDDGGGRNKNQQKKSHWRFGILSGLS